MTFHALLLIVGLTESHDTTCNTLLNVEARVRAHDAQVWDTLERPPLYAPMLATLDSVTREFWSATNGNWPISAGSNRTVDSLAGQAERRVSNALGSPDAIAKGLAQVMWGVGFTLPGFTQRQAAAASYLYLQWHLPPLAARELALETRAPLKARGYAIRALKGSWETTETRLAVASVLCSLAARGEGIAAIRAVPDSTLEVKDVLSVDELDVLSWVLDAVHSSPMAIQRWYASRLPPKNPVKREVEGDP